MTACFPPVDENSHARAVRQGKQRERQIEKREEQKREREGERAHPTRVRVRD